MATIEGYRLQNWRYSSRTEELINNYYERETWSKNDWQIWSQNQIDVSLNNAKKFVPFYQKYWKNKNESYDILENWPIIKKQDIINSPEAFIDTRFNKSDLYRDHTSGTTGSPLDIYLDKKSVTEQYALFEARVKRKYNINFNESWAIVGSQIVTSVKRKKPPFWVYNFASKQLYFSSIHIADWTITHYLNAFIKYQPRFLIGYTYSIFEIAKWMVENNKTFKLKAVITNAEPLYDFQKKYIGKAFDCPVVETYGQAELVCFANTFPDGKMYQSPEMGITECINIQSYEDGAYGELIATGLLNKAMPLIRYNTDDLISTKKTEDTNGALPKFNKILGRNDDVIVLKDGRKIVQIDGIFSTDLNIQKGQIIQEDFSTFTIKIVPASNWKDNNKDIVRSKMLERLGNVSIEIEICKDIKKTWAGKFRVIKSNLKQVN